MINGKAPRGFGRGRWGSAFTSDPQPFFRFARSCLDPLIRPHKTPRSGGKCWFNLGVIPFDLSHENGLKIGPIPGGFAA
jgi:hypothetical protein